MKGFKAGTGNCSGGSAVAGEQLQERKTRGFPLHGTEQELGRPEEQFGSETTHGCSRSEGGIGLSRIPGCLLRAVRNLRKKNVEGRGAPAQAAPIPPGAAGCDSHQPDPAPFSSWPGHSSQLRLLLLPLTLPGHRDELELLHRHNPGISVHSQPHKIPGLALRKMGKPEVRHCWDESCLEQEFPRATGEGRGPVSHTGLGTPRTHSQAHRHSLCPCNTTPWKK